MIAAPAPRAILLASPPRGIPLGLRLALLCPRDIVAANLYVVPAAGLLALGTGAPTNPRIGLTVVATVLIVLALQVSLPALATALRNLSMMRNGVSSVGRIVACRLPWDKPGTEIDYADFLRDWVVHAGKSQMRAASGCFARLVLLGVFLFIGGPILAGVLFVAVSSRTAEWREHGLVVAGAAGCVVLLALLARHGFRRRKDKMAATGQEDRATPAGKGDYSGDWAEQEARRGAERGAAIPPANPLPRVEAMSIPCRIDCSPRPGERFTGEGLVRLRDRLDPGGVEPLLFDPDRPGQVVFFNGLPDVAAVSSRGEWEAASPTTPAIKLGLTLAAWVAATTFLLANLASFVR